MQSLGAIAECFCYMFVSEVLLSGKEMMKLRSVYILSCPLLVCTDLCAAIKEPV